MSGVFAVDIGAAYSHAVLHRNEGNVVFSIPSYVMISPSGEESVGVGARENVVAHSANVAYGFKQWLGCRPQDSKCFQHVTSSFNVNIPHIKFRMENGTMKKITPREAVSMLIQALKQTLEEHSGRPLNRVVIVAPSYSTEVQRSCLKSAAEGANLKVLDIIDEASASFLGAKELGLRNLVLTLDLGSSGCRVTIFRTDYSQHEKSHILSLDGSASWGGNNFDQSLFEHCVNQTVQTRNYKIKRQRDFILLAQRCETAKKDLSTATECTIEVPLPENITPYQIKILRNEFERFCAPLFTECEGLLSSALSQAGLAATDITDVVCCGNGSHIPRIQQILQDTFRNSKIHCHTSPPDLMIKFAAQYAATLANSPIFIDVNNYSLSLSPQDENSFLIQRGSYLPVSAKEQFVTMQDNQELMKNKLYAIGANQIDTYCLGHYSLNGLPRAPKRQVKVNVNFTVDRDKLLRIYACAKHGDKQEDLEVYMESEGAQKIESKKLLPENPTRVPDNTHRTRKDPQQNAQSKLSELKAFIESNDPQVQACRKFTPVDLLKLWVQTRFWAKQKEVELESADAVDQKLRIAKNCFNEIETATRLSKELESLIESTKEKVASLLAQSLSVPNRQRIREIEECIPQCKSASIYALEEKLKSLMELKDELDSMKENRQAERDVNNGETLKSFRRTCDEVKEKLESSDFLEFVPMSLLHSTSTQLCEAEKWINNEPNASEAALRVLQSMLTDQISLLTEISKSHLDTCSATFLKDCALVVKAAYARGLDPQARSILEEEYLEQQNWTKKRIPSSQQEIAKRTEEFSEAVNELIISQQKDKELLLDCCEFAQSQIQENEFLSQDLKKRLNGVIEESKKWATQQTGWSSGLLAQKAAIEGFLTFILDGAQSNRLRLKLIAQLNDVLVQTNVLSLQGSDHILELIKVTQRWALINSPTPEVFEQKIHELHGEFLSARETNAQQKQEAASQLQNYCRRLQNCIAQSPMNEISAFVSEEIRELLHWAQFSEWSIPELSRHVDRLKRIERWLLNPRVEVAVTDMPLPKRFSCGRID
eukprot:Gregarina_sp_Poly_1__2751@NODE_1762_length_3384_cov_96_273138_g1151_i0_p1_GENE_NODE_1762_length_3384_cov_96_273138_g1151_i0NODE_1762_length_3384_cov_96_273138_g1151_i0_p1_ORF_typecomplete_len1055_score178_07HSP70/PF00012_20/2_1e53HSP70/PF00012_20/5_9e02HSP70/PF00012_20/4_3e02HSP70/PF00012_20/2_3e03MreB_Mbl/PF06723_13/4_3e16MreB_Mbl/PF06723_13/1_6e03PilM_2/PF11104_8/0_0022PilM_2/PF11104_8/4_3e03BcrAD_BadFG/PF01869_20/7_3e02BcrAD_BadFG/PF01869_20/0_92TrbI_Ftype/PF09677_10/2_1e02TrbI_Ftype/PF09677_